MPLAIQTGRQLSIKIATVIYSVQTAEVTLVPNTTVDQYITLTGKAAIAQPTTWELNVRGFQDWGEASSFMGAMVTAAAAGTAVAFELTLPGTGKKATGNIIPVYPPAGGAADAALEFDMTFQVSGDVTYV